MNVLASRFAVPAGAACAALLLARPYEGIQHDAVLYFGQVLSNAGVEALARDPFFAGGSQDAFSLYSGLIKPLHGLVGVGMTHQAWLLASFAAAVWAVWRLLRDLGAGPASAAGLLALATLSPVYGGTRVFGILEPFLTARSLAEPLVLWSLVALARGRLFAGASLQVLAALFHPLMALPALLVTALLAVQRDRRWLALLGAVPIALALAATGLAPWDRLLRVYDPYWWALVSQSNVQVVLANWAVADWLTVATDTCVVAAVSRLAMPTEARRLLQALLVAAGGLLLINAVGTDLLRNVLITQLQPWRVLWLLHLMALATAPWLVLACWQRGGLWRVSTGLLALALLSSHAGSAYGLPLLAGWVASLWGARQGWRVSRTVIGLALTACASGLLLMSAARLALELERQYWHPPVAPAFAAFATVATAPLVAFAVLGALAWLLRRGLITQWACAASVAALMLAAAWHWDRRDDLARQLEALPPSHPFQAHIPPNASVYWPDQLAAIWGRLERVSHYSRQQGAGMLFNRATAEIIGPRREAYRLITEDHAHCEMGVALAGKPQGLIDCLTPSVERLRTLCNGQERPDYLVFETPLPRRFEPLAVWQISSSRFHLYRCTQLATPGNSHHD